MSAQSTEDSDVMYDINERLEGGWLITEKTGRKRLTATARGGKSKRIPDELHQPYMTTPEVLKNISYHSLDDNEPVYVGAKTAKVVRDMPIAMVMSTQKITELGHLERLARLQSLLVDPETEPYLMSLERNGHESRKGTTHNLTWSVQATHAEGTIQPGAIAKAQSPKVMEIVKLVTTIGSDLVKAFPGAWTAEHEKQWIKEASLTCGVDQNKSITSIQLNFSAVKERPSQVSDKSAELQDSLKDKAHVHDDGGDERRGHSVIFFLSYVPKDHFVGRFNILNYRLTCTCAPFTALVLNATNPHGSSAFTWYPSDLPLDSPLRYTPPVGFAYPKLPKDTPYTRINTIAYSRQDCMRARRREIHEMAYRQEGLGAFLTKRNQNTHRMRQAIKDGLDIGVDNPTVQEYVDAFGWQDENSGKQYPELDIAEKGIFYREENDNSEWELMFALANYNNAHLTKDEPTRYVYGKKRKAKRNAMIAAGDAWYCDYIKSDGKKCKTPKIKGVEGATKCHNHLGKENPMVDDDADDWENVADEKEYTEKEIVPKETYMPEIKKRSRVDGSAEQNSEKRAKVISTHRQERQWR